MSEIGYLNLGTANDDPQIADLVMADLEKLLKQSEFVHDLQGRGMDRIPAEIAEEILVLFEYGDADPGARQQKPEHDTRRSSAGDAARGTNWRFGHVRSLLCETVKGGP